ncbi:phasin family protein [Burkholderia sp. lig30]|jgi:phasin family protein|uniref:phasin family protein n=1 Tax=Burkholderia sp. lig30 TaxID=1192124 RepID=UPI000461619C|nr:phasin family protein [Burkholderia sp. lig30]KDB08696.1 phasin family protein [Burkholderia sp. lig30]
MTVFAAEQLMADLKSGVDAWFAWANPAFKGVEAVVDLNVQTARATFAECEDNLKGAFGGGNPGEYLTRQLGASQQVAGKAASYGRQLFDIAAATQAEWMKVAQAQHAQTDKRVKDTLGQLTKNAPAGSAAVVAVVNSALSTAAAAAETVHAVTGRVIESAQHSLGAVAASAPAGTAAPRAGNTRREPAVPEETA